MTTATQHPDPEFEPITRDGRPWLRHVPTGREIPVVSGGAEGDPPAGQGAGTPPPAGDGQGQGTQPPAGQGQPPQGTAPAGQQGVSAEDRARIEAEARTAAQAEFEAWLAEQKRQHDLSEMDEATRLRTEAETAQAEAAAATAAAQLAVAGTHVVTALLKAGVAPDSVDTVARMVPVTPDTDPAKATELVEALKTQVPAVFTTPGTTAPPPGAPGTPTPPAGPKGGQGTTSAADRAKARLAAKGVTPRSETNTAA